MKEEYNVSLADEGVDIIVNLIGEELAEKMMTIAASSFNRLNPYHNSVHELQHVYWSYACVINEPGISADGLTPDMLATLAVASLFHDHNHSGGRRKDDENIKEALSIIPVVVNGVGGISGGFGLDWPAFNQATIERLIRVTQFNGLTEGFEVKEPTNVLESAMRDADLMSIYSEEGRDLLMGLQYEMGHPFENMKTSEVNDTLEKNANFLRNAPMYTHYGNKIKEYYLEDALKAYAEQVKASL
jgi:hypothetical protein